MSRTLAAWLCCTAMVFGLACGKYGRPERVASSSPAVSAAVSDAPNAALAETPDAADAGDKKKSPKR